MRFKDFLNEWSKTSRGIKQHLIDLGYKFLAKGVDQSAYLEPKTGKVLKIFGTAENDDKREFSGFSKDQMMFKTWSDYCTKHKNNEFLPKFDGWEAFDWEDKKYLQIRMERLQRLPSELADALENTSELIGKYRSPPQAHELIVKIVDNVHDLDTVFGYWYRQSQMEELEKLLVMLGKKKFEELLYTIADVAHTGRDKGYTFDLHGGNFMHRNDGIPVIVDPWVYDGSY